MEMVVTAESLAEARRQNKIFSYFVRNCPDWTKEERRELLELYKKIEAELDALSIELGFITVN